MVGFHWVFVGFIYTILAALLALTGLYVTVHFGFPVGAVIWLLLVVSIGILAATFGPLEAKSSKWQP